MGILIKRTSARLVDEARKDLLRDGLKIKAEANHYIDNFVEVTTNFRVEKRPTARTEKPDNDPLFKQDIKSLSSDKSTSDII